MENSNRGPRVRSTHAFHTPLTPQKKRKGVGDASFRKGGKKGAAPAQNPGGSFLAASAPSLDLAGSGALPLGSDGSQRFTPPPTHPAVAVAGSLSPLPMVAPPALMANGEVAAPGGEMEGAASVPMEVDVGGVAAAMPLHPFIAPPSSHPFLAPPSSHPFIAPPSASLKGGGGSFRAGGGGGGASASKGKGGGGPKKRPFGALGDDDVDWNADAAGAGGAGGAGGGEEWGRREAEADAEARRLGLRSEPIGMDRCGAVPV